MSYSSIVFQHAQKTKGPVPATGRHAEQLGEVEQACHALLALVERERRGIFDGLSLDWWVERDTSAIGSHPDPLINMSKKILLAAERRLAEYREANSR